MTKIRGESEGGGARGQGTREPGASERGGLDEKKKKKKNSGLDIFLRKSFETKLESWTEEVPVTLLQRGCGMKQAGGTRRGNCGEIRARKG